MRTRTLDELRVHLRRISHEELERYVAACAAASLISPTPTLEVAS